MLSLVHSTHTLPPPHVLGPELYNMLPTIEGAASLCTPAALSAMTPELSALLATFGCEWGMCLVHAHCTLAEGELMLARGNVSQPEMMQNLLEPYFPERWLADGRAFEYNAEKTAAPPAELVTQFHAIVTKAGLAGILGLYFAGNTPPVAEDRILLEHTEGRANIIESIDVRTADTGNIQTAWRPNLKAGPGMPVTLACVTTCPSNSHSRGPKHSTRR
ncbi:hypothetical protein MVEN_01735200 [Mycena venus]|uniref:Uncharacterized protein n=1 Tax=Mycena venus TaxID=2733690 RepID=A0A8H6XLY6_9AGAR|nr:hypothetical protein MVEN_01735200 [Mycena venus]